MRWAVGKGISPLARHTGMARIAQAGAAHKPTTDSCVFKEGDAGLSGPTGREGHGLSALGHSSSWAAGML